MSFSLEFPFAYGGPVGRADFRTHDVDFKVRERLGFEPEGSGEHVYLQVLKRGHNTQWLAEEIARFAGVGGVDVGFCGLKDRHAETSQWFSVYLPKGGDPDWEHFCQQPGLNVEVLAVGRGQKKLRRGQHQSNHFEIMLRNVTGSADEIERRLQQIATTGVPNYFGEQRFGRQCSNLVSAESWLVRRQAIKPKGKKGLILSAARSYLFNRVLCQRVLEQNWAAVLPGDCLTGSLATGPLWGRGRSRTLEVAADIEERALGDLQKWLEGLEHCGLNQERRPFVLLPEKMSWQCREDSLLLSFGLAPGQYATSVLREIVNLNNCSGPSAAF